MANPAKPGALQQIEELQLQIERLKQGAVDELKQKLVAAREVVSQLEKEFGALTGEKTSKEAKTRRQRRPSITDEALKDQVVKVMSSYGKEGMNAKQLAAKLNQDPMRVRTFIKNNGKVLKRQGSGPGTKFFLP